MCCLNIKKLGRMIDLFKFLMFSHMGEEFSSFHIIARDRARKVDGSFIEIDF